ncbi:MAG: N-acetylmuramic acid 6-phosphate etherase [Bacteroidales bacterium]|nr:N-acetylmuramic acid 6-phosphate etherase [Bacteroidales bacterium]
MRTTEQDSRYAHLDKMSTLELLEGMNAEDMSVPRAVRAAIPSMEKFVDAIVERMSRGGRVFYVGAGTSGRLGVVDASEIPPTYGVRDRFIGIIAGGDGAIRTAVEGAEDDMEQGWRDIGAFSPAAADTVIGIAASGMTPYVLGAVRAARAAGLLTGGITCNECSPLSGEVDFPLEAVVGPEFVTGSTRMKSGTATKLMLNMISTAVMIRLGHVSGSRMVDMQPTNSKLRDRGVRMLMDATGMEDYEKAGELLLRYGSVRLAAEAYNSGREI